MYLYDCPSVAMTVCVSYTVMVTTTKVFMFMFVCVCVGWCRVASSLLLFVSIIVVHDGHDTKVTHIIIIITDPRQ